MNISISDIFLDDSKFDALKGFKGFNFFDILCIATLNKWFDILDNEKYINIRENFLKQILEIKSQSSTNNKKFLEMNILDLRENEKKPSILDILQGISNNFHFLKMLSQNIHNIQYLLKKYSISRRTLDYYTKYNIIFYNELKNDQEPNMNEINLLHLSDPQFGKDMDRIDLEYLVRKLKLIRKKGKKFDFFVITGDLTSTGSKHEFMSAYHLIDSILQIFESTNIKKIYLVPGNHDINYKLSRISRNLKLENYNNFLNRIYKENPTKIIEFIRYHPGVFIPIVRINSNYKIDHQKVNSRRQSIDPREVFYIVNQINNFNEKNGISTKKPLIIFLIHHPPHLIENFNQNILCHFENLGYSLNLFLHGHDHAFLQPNLYKISNSKISMAIGSGSSSLLSKWRNFPGYDEKNKINHLNIKIESDTNNNLKIIIKIEVYNISAKDIEQKPQLYKYSFNFSDLTTISIFDGSGVEK
jgi:Icc-related predicted phosphoesterase